MTRVRLESEPILAVGSFDLEVSRGGCENASASGLGIDDELGGTLRRRFEGKGQASARRGRERAEDGTRAMIVDLVNRRDAGDKKKRAPAISGGATTTTHLRGVRGQFLGSRGGHGVVSRGECGGDACIACGVSREWREVAAVLNPCWLARARSSRMTEGTSEYAEISVDLASRDWLTRSTAWDFSVFRSRMTSV